MRKLAMIILPVFLLQGCAASVVGSERKVSVDTDNGVRAQCLLENNSGSTVVGRTPGAAFVRGSLSDLTVSCSAPGWSGRVSVSSGLEAATLGNLTSFGPVGMLGDLTSGGITNYDARVVVPMHHN